MLRYLAFCATLAGLPGTAAAHDFWLYPSAHDLAAPGAIDVRVCLGQPNDVNDLERQPAHIKKFEAYGATGRSKLTGVPGKTPAGHVDLAEPGIYTLLYESHFNMVTLAPRKFDGYLAEEGLFEIVVEREKRNESELPGVDSFSRYAKALVRVGNASDGYDRRLGLQAELVATTNPFVGGEGGFLEFQLWYLDKQHAGALVELFAVETKNIKSVAKTTSDKDGLAKFATPGPGRYIATATTMRRASYPIDGDWESSWASLAFEVVSTGGGAPPAKGGFSKKALLAAIGTGVLLLAGWQIARRRRPAAVSR